LLAESRDNFFVYNKFLKDEKELNSIINEIDVLFCAYLNFNKSSNMLTKAAYFKKPIMVSKGYEMETNVEKYGIGVCVQEDDTLAMLEALQNLERQPVDAACFAAYNAVHNGETMAQSLEQFLDACLKQG
jgi:hypothetical protein